MRTDGFFSFLFFVPRSPTSKICSPFSQFLFLDFGFLGCGDSAAMLLCPIGLFVFLGEHLILRRGSRVIPHLSQGKVLREGGSEKFLRLVLDEE